ncbi:MAG: hypothetical protein TEF_15525 [Rhizobiales bacterium NRL2]|jgi:acyl-CoA dehydrogenase|nr:MAG: hypothetical protein TEF_15525 [Rhizobiales bacterium NRL2]
MARHGDRSEGERAFTASVRRFLDENLTPDLQAAGRATVGTHSEIGACRAWHQRLHRRGWIAPAWPIEYGGTGWPARQRLIFEHECAERDAPVLFAGGLRNVGPILIARGDADQRRRYLPRILSGADLWCQGYSEPGAGSDLAALDTRAVRDGDRYIVTGRKVWTTGAQHANRMFALVRTSRQGKPQEGITFLLIDMATPGIEVRPIPTMYGEAEFNEVTFDGVAVPAADRVGPENGGWGVAKDLMNFARASNTTTGLLRRTFRRVRAIAATVDADGEEQVRLAALAAELTALEQIERHAASRAPGAPAPEAEASLLKLTATELHQRITALGVALAGPSAFACLDPESAGAPFFAEAGIRHLATRAATIYSGTSEIHRNVMARHLLDFRPNAPA